MRLFWFAIAVVCGLIIGIGDTTGGVMRLFFSTIGLTVFLIITLATSPSEDPAMQGVRLFGAASGWFALAVALTHLLPEAA